MISKNRTVSKLLTTSNVDLYTVPASYEANIKSIYVNNKSGSAATFSLDHYDSQTATWHTLADAVSMPNNSLLQITDSLWFYKADKFRGLASVTDAITVTFNIEEFYMPTRS